MPVKREVELKYVLKDASTLKSLATSLGDRYCKTLKQRNYFFVPPNGLRRPYCLRLRDEDGHFWLTAKGDQKFSGLLTNRLEIEQEISVATAKQMLQGTISPLEVLIGNLENVDDKRLSQIMLDDSRHLTFYCAGSFDNVREIWEKQITIDNDKTITLYLEYDTVHFSGQELQYELEIELPEEWQNELSSYFELKIKKLGIPIQTAASKATRFFQYAHSS